MGRVKQTPVAAVGGAAAPFSSCRCAVEPPGPAQKRVCGCLLRVFPERCYVQRGRSCEKRWRTRKKRRLRASTTAQEVGCQKERRTPIATLLAATVVIRALRKRHCSPPQRKMNFGRSGSTICVEQTSLSLNLQRSESPVNSYRVAGDIVKCAVTLGLSN